MFDRIRDLVLRLARVPPAPQPPFGAPESIRVFRAGRNYYRLRLLGWLGAQLATTFGIIMSLGFLQEFKHSLRDRSASPPAAESPANPGEPTTDSSSKLPWRQWTPPPELVRRVPAWVLPLVVVGETIGIAVFLLQLPVTFAAIRLDFEMRWYIVTDRSLRIRSGIMKLQESTMSFANLQQVIVSQGPVQRLLGLADVRVQSAGGGGGGGETNGKRTEDLLHVGIFHAVENAHQVRDLILERLRIFRETGLGDPDDRAAEAHPSESPALAAARELLGEARALRRALEQPSG